jgi:hypothetical protein
MYKIAEAVKTLRLTRSQLDTMVKTDITSQFCASCSDEDVIELRAYTQGLRDGIVYSIIKDHCEFVYFLDTRRFSQAEAVAANIPQHDGAIAGYQWSDTHTDFSDFAPLVQL